jgi:DNA-binding IscR family transcriptional regulator
MRVTAMQEYGLRCMLQIASHKVATPLPVREIAKRERLTPVYVEKILVNLRKAGMDKRAAGFLKELLWCVEANNRMKGV